MPHELISHSYKVHESWKGYQGTALEAWESCRIIPLPPWLLMLGSLPVSIPAVVPYLHIWICFRQRNFCFSQVMSSSLLEVTSEGQGSITSKRLSLDPAFWNSDQMFEWQDHRPWDEGVSWSQALGGVSGLITGLGMSVEITGLGMSVGITGLGRSEGITGLGRSELITGLGMSVKITGLGMSVGITGLGMRDWITGFNMSGPFCLVKTGTLGTRLFKCQHRHLLQDLDQVRYFTSLCLNFPYLWDGKNNGPQYLGWLIGTSNLLHL